MHDDAQRSGEIEIRTPCPKRWEELAGAGRKRYCDACQLHVHDGSAMTRSEARALIQGSPERICMRLHYDPSGTPVFQDTPARDSGPRIPRWAFAAVAGALAACHDVSPPPEGPVEPPDKGHLPSRMGRPAVPEVLGQIAIVEPPMTSSLGEVVAPLPPTTPPEPPR